MNNFQLLKFACSTGTAVQDEKISLLLLPVSYLDHSLVKARSLVLEQTKARSGYP